MAESQTQSSNRFSQQPASQEQEIDWSQFTPIPKATGLQRLKDIGASFASGAVGATKAISDAAGADNAVSAGLGRMQDATQSWISPERQAEQERRAATIQAAEKGDSRLREIGAQLGGIAEAPVSTFAQAAGSVVPVVASMLATRGRAPAALVGTTLGVAQGAGAVKGSIHEAVKDEHLQAGATEEAASAAAEKAQAYGGDNTGQIALGGALGGLAARFGVEGMLARSMAGRAAAGGASALGRIGVGAVSEGAPELVQGGQERLAANLALQNEGFDTPTWQGVAGQAVAEGVAGTMLGGATNAFAHGQPRQSEPQTPSDAPTAAGAPAEPTVQEAAPAVAAQASTIDPDDNPETGIDPELSPAAQPGIDPAAGPLSRNVAKEMERGATPAPRPIHERIQDLPDQERTQAIILADEINNLDNPEGVRQFRRTELDSLLQQHEQQVAADGPISRNLSAHRPSTALATSALTEDDPADWHKVYRRNPVGVPYQSAGNPLADAQQAVRQSTEYTDPQRVQAVRGELEDAWLALNVSNEPVSQQETLSAPVDRGDITPEIDARVRAGRVVSGVRNAFEGGAPNTLRVIQSVNQALRNIGDQSLTQDEIARIRRVADARTAFMGLNLPAALPIDPVQQPPAVDALADNSAMEALIPERPALQPAMEQGTPVGAADQAQRASAGNADIAGDRVGGEWVAFGPSSGTLGVPRAQMPQVDAAHRGALVNYLKGQGIASEQAEVPANSLKPTQAEFSEAKVRKASKRTGGDRAILVSSDGYVVDGHHQWLAKRQDGQPVKVLQLQAPISQLLPLVGDFPSARTAEGAQATSQGQPSNGPATPLNDESQATVPDAPQVQPQGPAVPQQEGRADATQAIEAQQAGARESNDRSMLKSALQELDASSLTPEQRAAVVQRAGRTGGAAAATQTIFDAVDGVAATTTAAQQAAKAREAIKSAAPAARIIDVGEKIGGARKDLWTGFKDDLRAVADDQIKAQPLSKVWPSTDYQKLIDAGAGADAVAMVRALRDAVETKPRQSYKVSRWADQVKVLRSFATDLLDGKVNVAALKADIGKLSSRSLRDVLGRAELYEAVGHGKSLEGITFGEHHYSLYRGRENVHLWAVEQGAKGGTFGNWPREIATGETKEAALEAFKKAYANLDSTKEKKAASFDIITEQFSSDYFVGKKMGRTYAKLAGPFKTTREARAYRDGNEAELLKSLEVFKQIPQERGDTNRPRVGQDYRQGQDVNPTQFRETFGFRGVEFGNWVEQGKRQQELNDAYDALMDLAAVLQLPAKAMSLNGELGMAFGARGMGGVGAFKAHYEPGKVVINLTKRTGAGSLGHEWWHAVDNYFSRMRSSANGYMTDSSDVKAAANGAKYFPRGEGVRPAMIEAFGAVMRAINATALRARSAKLDERRTKDYWSTDIELSARAFESYLIGKLQDQNASNDYLANVVSPKAWEAAATVGLRQDDAYPYPTADEIQAIRAGFDHFFQTVETRETDHGLALFSSRTTPPESKLSLERVQQIVQTALRGIPGSPPVHVVHGPADLGLVVAGEDVHSGVTLRSGDIYVFQSGVGSELDVLKTVFHELFHRGLRNVLPADQYVQTMLDLAKRDDRVQSYANAWKGLPVAAEQRAELAKMGFAGSELQARFEALAIEEGLAVVAEELKAEKQAGTRSLRLRSLTTWLASIADKLGLTSVANAIRRMSYNEAERFVLSAIDASGQAVATAHTTTNPAADVNKMRTAAPQEVAKVVGDTLKGMTVQNLRKQAGFKVTDYMGIGLQFLGRRQLTEVYSPILPQLKRYSDLMARMDADKNEAGAGADELATEWGKLKDETALAELMHDATLAQIDPAKDFVEGDNKAEWQRLKARYGALTPEARGIYQRARDSYRDHMRQVRQAIKERIERSDMTGQRKADMIKQLDGDFFGHIKGVYFPLARFGQYVVVVKNAEGKAVNVSRAETMAEADTLRGTLAGAYPADQGYTVGKVLKSKDFVADRDTVGSGFIQELYGLLEKQGMDAKQRAELEDSIGQLYLASMPDLSWAKHGIHRKGTAGFSQDARRAFAQNTFHGARYLAKLRYSDLLQDELTDMDKYISMHDSDAKYPSVRARQVLDEMVKRHESAMNPTGNPLSTALTSFGFMFHLGLSPASAMVNLTQTALVAYPVMGAKWGYAKASEALLRASKETVLGKNDITNFLNSEEKAAFDEAVRSGVIDVTMAHDLAGIAQGEDSGVMWRIRPLMKWASFLFHHAEKFNRSATFVASYRLARDAGSDHYRAYAEAVKATYDGHFDYSSNNRPRFMQGNVARVLLLFKQYSQNMVYAFARSAQQSLKGQTAKERAEARKMLGGLLVMHGMAAGALGLPMVSTLLAVASMLGGDDDEPFDAQIALQNMLADTLGQKPAEVLSHGLSRLTPWDISGRVGLDNLIFPDLQEGLEGQRLAESAMASALGPVAGIGVNVLRGLQDMADGDYLRGLEGMMPSFLRGPLKSIRYGADGVVDRSGIVVKDDVDYAGLIGQFAGFSPSEVRLAYEGKAAISKHDRALAARRSTLMEQFALAAMAGDEEGKVEAREAISRFNEKNPSRAIKPMQLAQSVRMRQRRINQAQEGVYLPRNRRDAVEAGRFAATGDGEDD
ncbi:PLxRFG domain-containing protein [Comamonas aquatica]|uniref:PLxRFG domain-containing protein n=1 Tax=Comamonas aquatica TaxID=225991 RepID=UPI003D09215C